MATSLFCLEEFDHAQSEIYGEIQEIISNRNQEIIDTIDPKPQVPSPTSNTLQLFNNNPSPEELAARQADAVNIANYITAHGDWQRRRERMKEKLDNPEEEPTTHIISSDPLFPYI